MKKLYLSFSSLLITLSVYSQNIYQVGSRVGIGNANPISVLSVSPINQTLSNFASTFSAGTFNVLGNNAGTYLYPFEFQHYNTGNVDRFQIAPYRRVAGAEWAGTAYRLQFAVDGAFTAGEKAYLEIGGSDPNAVGGGFISLGTQGLDRLVVTGAGFVGIGTNSPKEALSVNGNIRSKEVKVENGSGSWPDYVFDKSHNMLSLQEIEIFINLHKHLPEIPSAEEVKVDGINLGYMNAKLLKKIEELTLLLIDQNKQIIALKERVDKL